MKTSGTTLSVAISTEQAVRNAYRQTSTRHQFIMRWKAGTTVHRLLQAGGLLCLACLAILVVTQSDNWLAFIGLMMLGAVLLGLGTLGAERRIFGEHFKLYGPMLNTRKGEPSKFRYLCFIDLVRGDSGIRSQHLEHLISVIEAQSRYRDYFSRRFALTMLCSTFIAALTSAGISHPIIWSTPLWFYILIYTIIFSVMAYFFSREWRSLRPNREARERELLAFLHMAVMDLEAPAFSSLPPAATSDMHTA